MCVISVCHDTDRWNLSLSPRDANATRSHRAAARRKTQLTVRRGKKGRNVQKSVFPVGEMRTTVKSGGVARGRDFRPVVFEVKAFVNRQ